MPIPKKIFLADDDADDALFFSDALKTMAPGCSLLVAPNGQELLDSLASALILPDLIILDINMPVLSGLDTLQAIKQEDRVKNIPVVMYSTSSNPDDITTARRRGASGYMVKPHTFENLIGMLKQLFEGYMGESNTYRPLTTGGYNF